MEEECCWKLNKDYDRKNDFLGRGSYGAVFKGKLISNDGNIEKVVAIKRIDKAMLMDEITYQTEMDTSGMLVIRELIQKKLNHPNVVKLLHVDEDNDFLLVNLNSSYYRTCQLYMVRYLTINVLFHRF